MITFILIIKTFLLSHLITNYKPIEWIFDWIKPYIPVNLFTKIIFNSLYLTLTCQKCLALYVGFILGGFWIGILASFITYLYLKLLQPKIDKITLPNINFTND